MTLVAQEKDEFRETGYVIRHAFFTAREISAMVAELERFKKEGLLRNVSTAGDGKTTSTTTQNLQVIPLFMYSDLFRALPFHPKVVATVSELIGEPTLLQLDQIFLKPGGHGAGTSWHQDNAYFKISDPTKGVGMWVALHDATVANGTMHVIPAMYGEALSHSRDLNSNHHIHCAPPEERAVAVEMKAGGALFFCYGVPHCTKANTTEKERAGLALHFVREDFATPDLIAPDRKERPLINGPGCTGGEKEYGVRVAGTWEAEVARVLGG